MNSFYKQNGFLEYEGIAKLGVSDPKQFIRKQLPNEDIIYLKRCAIGTKVIDLTVLSSLNECSATKSYVDLATILPSNMSEEDIEEVFETIMARKGATPANFVFLQSIGRYNIIFIKIYFTNKYFLLMLKHLYITVTAGTSENSISLPIKFHPDWSI